MDDKDRQTFLWLYAEGTKHLHDGRLEEALPLLLGAHDINPDHVDAALNLSSVFILKGKFKKAVAILESLTDQAPDNVMVWINMGAAYLGNPILARDEEQLRAIGAFERALAINPGAPNVAYNLGLIYRDRMEIDEARRWFKRALQVNPQDRDARKILEQLSSESKQT